VPSCVRLDAQGGRSLHYELAFRPGPFLVVVVASLTGHVRPYMCRRRQRIAVDGPDVDFMAAITKREQSSLIAGYQIGSDRPTRREIEMGEDGDLAQIICYEAFSARYLVEHWSERT
jgi:hypothetical protein